MKIWEKYGYQLGPKKPRKHHFVSSSDTQNFSNMGIRWPDESTFII